MSRIKHSKDLKIEIMIRNLVDSIEINNYIDHHRTRENVKRTRESCREKWEVARKTKNAIEKTIKIDVVLELNFRISRCQF